MGSQEICERLLADCNAKLVALIDDAGHELGRAGEAEGFDSQAVAKSFWTMHAANGEFTAAFHEGERTNVHVALVRPGVILVVVFDARSSLGLVRLRVREVIGELSRPSGGGSPSSGGPGGAAPAQASIGARRPS